MDAKSLFEEIKKIQEKNMAIAEIANLLGLPEYITKEEAVEALKTAIEGGLFDHEVLATQSTSAAAEDDSAEIEKIISRWAIALRWYWVEAARALARRDYREMRRLANLARERERRVSPEGRLLAAIFTPGPIPLPTEAELLRGEKISPETAAEAKSAVMAEIRAHDARMKKKRAQERAERAAIARKEREERRKAAEEGALDYLKGIHDQIFESARIRLSLRKIEGFMDDLASIQKDATGTVGLLVDKNQEFWALSRSALWWCAFRQEGPKTILKSALVRATPTQEKIDAWKAAEKAAETERARAKRAKMLAHAAFAIDWANAALAIAAEKRGGVVVEPIKSPEEIVEAHESGRLVGQVLTESGEVLGMKPFKIISAGGNPEWRNDWPSYLAGEVRSYS